MLRHLVLCVCLVAGLSAPVLAWDISGYETANRDRGQWSWFTGQSQKCKEPIPMPASLTRAEWERRLTVETDKLPCGGAGLSERAIKHIYLFLHTHAKDSDQPMTQKPQSCG